MKKKSWIFSLLLAVIVLPCLVLLSACGKDENPNVTGFSVYIGETLVAENSKTINATYGDTINIESRITVKLIYDDNTMEIIDNNSSGYSLSGVPSIFNAGSYEITVSYGEYSGIGIILEVAKATPMTPSAREGAINAKLLTVELPTGWAWDNTDADLTASGNFKASFAGNSNYNAVVSANVYVLVKQNPIFSAQTGRTATYGDTLADIEFVTSASDTVGSWAWTLPLATSVGDAGTKTFRAIFTPTDTTTYVAKTVEIEITVNKKTIAVPDVVGTYTYNGTEQTANIATSDYYTLAGDLKATNAKGYLAITATLADPLNTKWGGWRWQPFGDNNKNIIINWAIKKAELTFSAKTLPAMDREYNVSKYYIGFDCDNFTYANGKYDITCASISEENKLEIINGLGLKTLIPYNFWYDGAVRKTTNLWSNNANLKLCVSIKINTLNSNVIISNIDDNGQILLDYNGRLTKATPTITTNPTAISINSGDVLTNNLITGGVVKVGLAGSTEGVVISLSEIAGTWAFKTQGVAPNLSGTQKVVFTPNSPCFNSVEIDIDVTVLTNNGD